MPIRFETLQSSTKRKVLSFMEEWNSPSTEIVVKTSGSTGVPKEITLQKKHMVASAKATGAFLGLKKGDSALLCLSMDTIGGRMMVVRSIVLELNLIVVDTTSTPLERLDEEICFAAMVPMQVKKSSEYHPEKLAKIKTLIIGGAPVSMDLITQIQDFPTRIYHTFGMTETISHIALRRLNNRLEKEFNCLPGITIQESAGSLIIDAPEIGVRNLHTNDSVELVSPTSFRWLGRTDFVINSGGVKLHPEEIEARINGLIPFPYFVFGVSDSELGEKLILAIESSDKLALQKSDFASILSRYAIPKEIRYFPEFNYTESGKLNRVLSKGLVHVAIEVL